MDLPRFPKWIKSSWQFSWLVVEGWLTDRGLSMGASLAFYTVFSMAPLLLIVIAIAGIFFGSDAARAAVVREFQVLAGSSAGESIDALLRSASQFGSGTLGILIGLGTFLVSATAAFIELQNDLDAILRAKAPSYSRYWVFLQQRLISLAMIAGISFLLMVSLTIDAAVSGFSRYFQADAVNLALAAITFLANLALSVALFTLIFRFLPNIRVAWRVVFSGATFSAVLFLIGKFLIGFYLGRSHVASTFGAAASLVTILLWFYYSSQTILIGAEFIAVLSGRRTQESEPVQRHRRASTQQQS